VAVLCQLAGYWAPHKADQSHRGAVADWAYEPNACHDKLDLFSPSIILFCICNAHLQICIVL
jgi:hypothetical protein